MVFYGSKQLADSFRTVRKNTLVIAEEIPEDKYGFRATPESRSVGEILGHVAVSTRSFHDIHAVQKIKNFAGFDWGAFVQRSQAAERQLQTKAQILAALRSGGETWASFLAGVSEHELEEVIHFSGTAVPPSKSRFEMILSVKEHEMHHRAQLMVIERLIGLVPHLTRERQARMAQPTQPPKT